MDLDLAAALTVAALPFAATRAEAEAAVRGALAEVFAAGVVEGRLQVLTGIPSGPPA